MDQRLWDERNAWVSKQIGYRLQQISPSLSQQQSESLGDFLFEELQVKRPAVWVAVDFHYEPVERWWEKPPDPAPRRLIGHICCGASWGAGQCEVTGVDTDEIVEQLQRKGYDWFNAAQLQRLIAQSSLVPDEQCEDLGKRLYWYLTGASNSVLMPVTTQKARSKRKVSLACGCEDQQNHRIDRFGDGTSTARMIQEYQAHLDWLRRFLRY